MTHVNPNIVQTHYRIRSGDDQALNADAGWAAALSTGASIAPDVTFRVRIEVEENAGASETVAGVLEASLNGGAFQPVTTTSTIVKAVASAQFAEDDATTNVLAGSSQSFIAGSGSEDGDGVNVSLLSQHTEWEYAIQIVSADVADSDTITLRVNGLDSYTNTVTITVSEVAAFQPRHGFVNFQDPGVF